MIILLTNFDDNDGTSMISQREALGDDSEIPKDC